jgi:hypothetical protein
MKLVSLAEYRRLVYADGSGPNLKTLRRRIKDIPGGRIELGRYFVDLDVFDANNDMRRGLAEKLEKHRTSPLLKGLI